jgi:hypothetical protein
MDKVTLLRILNPVLFAVFLLQAVTGLAMLFGIAAPALLEVHEINGPVLIAVIAVHLGLNWHWVRVQYLRRRKPPA